MKSQIEKIKTEFTKQSAIFNNYMTTDIKTAFNEKAIAEMQLTGQEIVLEVAAGTCAFGRMIAPKISHITEFDVTEAMLLVGKNENEKQGIFNANYVIGEAEHLPFDDNSFDIVVSRLAFHHFANTEAVFAEMYRVLKPNGKIVVADMLAKSENERESADRYETLRDPSHVRCLSFNDFEYYAKKYCCVIEHQSITEIPMNLNSWMTLTDVPLNIREQIICDMKNDISGLTKTGFNPYIENSEIMFNHNWLLFIASKI